MIILVLATVLAKLYLASCWYVSCCLIETCSLDGLMICIESLILISGGMLVESAGCETGLVHCLRSDIPMKTGVQGGFY